MLQEEEYWALKSRLNTATFRDQNASYFHITTVVRRQRNKIRCVMDGSSEWIYDEAKIREHIQYEFFKLYTSEMCMVCIHSPVVNFPWCMLSEEERSRMGREVDDKEIRVVLWSLKAFNLMDCMLDFSSIFGMMCKPLSAMKLTRLSHLELFWIT